MPANRNVTTLETYTGQYVDLLNPDPATIKLADIAVGLANTARFAGQINRFYSVAEHAVRVSLLLPREYALAGLHHDSHEAYIGDITAPLKRVLWGSGITLVAAKLDHAIAVALELAEGDFKHPSVKAADDEALYREAAALKWSHGIGAHWNNSAAAEPWAAIGWSPQRAERKFTERHLELMGV